MAKVELKTSENDESVDTFINSVDNDTRRNDSIRVLEMFKRITGEEPKMWGPSIVGFGKRHLKYESGREMDWMITGFSPRKQNITLYVVCNSPKQPDLLAKLGKHKAAVSCLYINKLADVNEEVLEAIVKDAYKHLKESKSAV